MQVHNRKAYELFLTAHEEKTVRATLDRPVFPMFISSMHDIRTSTRAGLFINSSRNEFMDDHCASRFMHSYITRVVIRTISELTAVQSDAVPKVRIKRSYIDPSCTLASPGVRKITKFCSLDSVRSSGCQVSSQNYFLVLIVGLTFHTD